MHGAYGKPKEVPLQGHCHVQPLQCIFIKATPALNARGQVCSHYTSAGLCRVLCTGQPTQEQTSASCMISLDEPTGGHENEHTTRQGLGTSTNTRHVGRAPVLEAVAGAHVPRASPPSSPSSEGSEGAGLAGPGTRSGEGVAAVAAVLAGMRVCRT